jgi:hypothetical protein
MGGIRKIFIVPNGGDPKLAIWCTRIYGKRAGSDYEQYIRTFDLRAAELQGSVKIDGKYFSDDYRLYWPGGRNAWGYRRDVGVMLIDMAIPEVVADNGQLAERHPMLGEGFALIAFKDAADPEQAGLYVRSANGRIYRLREDLSVIETNEVSPDADGIHARSIPGNWDFYSLKYSKGKHAHTKGSSCAEEKSATLLAPQFIPEMNHEVWKALQKRIWVMHKSVLLGDYDLLLSYVGEDGVAHNTINVSALVSGDALKVISTYTCGREVFIFVSAGKTFHSAILGFSLSALRTDVETGELLERLIYF